MQDRVALGVPDFYYLLKGVSGWLECKLIPSNGHCPQHLTLEQVMWGEEEVVKGGHWYMLGLRVTHWQLYDVLGARALYANKHQAGIPKSTDKGERQDHALFTLAGHFPTREILSILCNRHRETVQHE
jgi:hypothetical protein